MISQNPIDSIYVGATKNSFIIPSAITYNIDNGIITLYNKSDLDIELEYTLLLDQDKNELLSFKQSHKIPSQEYLKIGNVVNDKTENYFYSAINFDYINQLYLKHNHHSTILLYDE